MYGILTYIWLKFLVNVGEYSIHGASGISDMRSLSDLLGHFGVPLFSLIFHNPLSQVFGSLLTPTHQVFLRWFDSNHIGFISAGSMYGIPSLKLT